MLTPYDWIRRSRTGAELLATLECLENKPELFDPDEKIGPPVTLFEAPCTRCRIYACGSEAGMDFCKTCAAIIARSDNRGTASREAVVVWANVSRIPDAVWEGKTSGKFDTAVRINREMIVFITDDNRFLMMTLRGVFKSWLQDLMMYYGSDIKGLMQIFPTVGEWGATNMSDLLCMASHHDSRFPMDMLRVRFFPNPFQVAFPHIRDEKGILTFEASEFLRLLEMASIFRTLIRPEHQKMLKELTLLKDEQEEQFYWGRFLGFLSAEARDMIEAWNIRKWNKNQIRLLYELREYAPFST